MKGVETYEEVIESDLPERQPDRVVPFYREQWLVCLVVVQPKSDGGTNEHID